MTIEQPGNSFLSEQETVCDNEISEGLRIYDWKSEVGFPNSNQMRIDRTAAFLPWPVVYSSSDAAKILEILNNNPEIGIQEASDVVRNSGRSGPDIGTPE